jgi:MoaA/NifB/PqqE/SkfB family radical SAM enzyme
MKSQYKIIEVELTTKCNLACPQCSRNYYGGKTWPSLPLVELDLKWCKEKLSEDFLSNLSQIRLVGTYGDPCMAKDFIPIVKWLKTVTSAQLFISTNGSLRTVKWWKELAQILGDQDRVMFGIDGLEDTNHLYRRGSNWNKIIENLMSFNNNGGKSIWQYIVFEHNEHQVEQARALSTKLNCHGFAVKNTNRFVNKKHQLVDSHPVLNKKDQVVYWLKLPSSVRYQNQGYKNYQESITHYGSYENYLKQTKISCFALHNQQLVVSAEGLVLPCAWLQDRLYGYEVEDHTDRQKLLDLIDQAGGWESVNLNHTSLESILNGNLFKLIQESWTNNHRLERCANMCGEMNTFGSSYKEIVQHL